MGNEGEDLTGQLGKGYRGPRFPDRELCPRWIHHAIDLNEVEVVSELYRLEIARSKNPEKRFIEYFALTKCPPTCKCSFRFERSPTQVYCNEQVIIDEYIRNDLAKNGIKGLDIDWKQPKEQTPPKPERVKEKTIRSLDALPDTTGTHHPHQHHGHDHQKQRRT